MPVIGETVLYKIVSISYTVYNRNTYINKILTDITYYKELDSFCILKCQCSFGYLFAFTGPNNGHTAKELPLYFYSDVSVIVLSLCDVFR